MRVPLNKIYRAFPDLDRFSDAECELLMQRVRLNAGARAAQATAAVVAMVLAFALVMAGISWIGSVLRMVFATRPNPLPEDYQLLASLTLALYVPVMSAIVTRDIFLRRHLLAAINVQIARVRCPWCKYILIGQREHDGQVTCPECGGSVALERLGITAADLIPPPDGGRTLIHDDPSAAVARSVRANSLVFGTPESSVGWRDVVIVLLAVMLFGAGCLLFMLS